MPLGAYVLWGERRHPSSCGGLGEAAGTRKELEKMPSQASVSAAASLCGLPGHAFEGAGCSMTGAAGEDESLLGFGVRGGS